MYENSGYLLVYCCDNTIALLSLLILYLRIKQNKGNVITIYINFKIVGKIVQKQIEYQSVIKTIIYNNLQFQDYFAI